MFITPTYINDKSKDIRNLLTESITEPIVDFTEPFFAELVFKISSLNLFSTEPMVRYRKMLKFRGMRTPF